MQEGHSTKLDNLILGLRIKLDNLILEELSTKWDIIRLRRNPAH